MSDTLKVLVIICTVINIAIIIRSTIRLRKSNKEMKQLNQLIDEQFQILREQMEADKLEADKLKEQKFIDNHNKLVDKVNNYLKG